MKRKIYTLLPAILAATLSAGAQTYYYDFDSSFSTTGVKRLAAPPNNASAVACLLLDGGQSYVASMVNDLVTNPGLQIGSKLKVNGDFDSTLCGSYCTTPTPVSSRTTGIYELSAGSDHNYYFASTGFGGKVLFGSAATDFDDQTYSSGYDVCTASAKWNDTIVIVGGVESGDGIIYAYKVNAATTGYAGVAGIITGATYPHGGTVAPFLPGMTTVGVEYLGVQSSGKILAAGYLRYMAVTDTGAFICRFKLNSLELDSTFGTHGIVYLGTATTAHKINSFYVASNDKIYLNYKEAGTANTFLRAFNADGSDYTGFGASGSISTGTTNVSRIRIIDNRLICGLSNNASSDIIWSYKTDGTPDTTLHANTNKLSMSGILTGTDFTVNDISSNATDEILIAGHYNNATPKREGLVIKLKKKLTIIPPPPTVVQDILTGTSLILSPNPATQNLRIQIGEGTEALNVKVCGADGTLAATRTIANGDMLNISDLRAGVYFLQVSNGTQTLHSRFVKQ